MIYSPIHYNNIQDKIEKKLEKLLRNKELKFHNDTIYETIITDIMIVIDNSVYEKVRSINQISESEKVLPVMKISRLFIEEQWLAKTKLKKEF